MLKTKRSATYPPTIRGWRYWTSATSRNEGFLLVIIGLQIVIYGYYQMAMYWFLVGWMGASYLMTKATDAYVDTQMGKEMEKTIMDAYNDGYKAGTQTLR